MSKLDINKIRGFMSPEAASGVFDQRLTDLPAAFQTPGVVMGTQDRSGLVGSYGYSETFADAMEALERNRVNLAWKNLREAEEDSTQERDAVVALSEMVFGQASKNQANGYAGLDASARVPLVQLPAFVYGAVS